MARTSQVPNHRRLVHSALLGLVAGILVMATSPGCAPALEGTRCAGDDDCPVGFHCDSASSLCSKVDGPDAAALDSGVIDARALDAAHADADQLDLSVPDSQLVDGSAPDSLTPDSLALDSRTTDSQTADTQTTDAVRTDSLRQDLASPDISRPDARQPDVSPCAAWPCADNSHCELNQFGLPDCVCDLTQCDDGSCRAPGECCRSVETYPSLYPDVAPSSSLMQGHFDDLWDLTACELRISFVYNANGLDDSLGWDGQFGSHAWAMLGIREQGRDDHAPSDYGVWMVGEWTWAQWGLAQDPSQDLDDNIILSRAAGHGLDHYDLPSSPPSWQNNHRCWFDRDGVDASQANHPLAVDGATYNTYGVYQIVILARTTGQNGGEAYLSVNGLDQGFETDGEWDTVELTPAGMTFSGDTTQMQVFFAMLGTGSLAHSVSFTSIFADGCRRGCDDS